MAGEVDPSSYKEVLLVLGTATLVVPAFHRLKLSPIFGFMIMGVLLGPDGLARFTGQIDWLRHITVENREQFAHVAEFGVVFLLFMIGLELSFERLRTMRKLVFGMGLTKIVAITLALAAPIMALGWSAREAAIVGACLALSSTALVVQVLSERKRLGTSAGRASFASLLMEDIAVVPLLVLVSVLAAASGNGLMGNLGLIALKAIVAVGGIVLIGRYLLRPVFRRVAQTHSPELFMAACLLVIVGTSLLTAVGGLSMALGAFLAGLLLAETEYRRQIEVTIEPFKGLLLGVFFFSVGLTLDLAGLVREPLLVLSGVVALLVIKGVVTYAVMRGFGIGKAAAIEGSALLAPGGEFAFVVLGLAVSLSVVGADIGGLAVTVATLTMAVLPILGYVGHHVGKRFEPQRELPEEAMAQPEGGLTPKVVIIGFGRVGKLVAAMLEEQRVAYVGVDMDPLLVADARRSGRPVFYGDAQRVDFLERCGAGQAQAIVVTMDNRASVEAAAAAVRELRPDVVLVARAKDRAHARQLYEKGVTEAVPEAFEASLHLAEATLIGAGVPLGLAIAAVHERRDQFRAEFQRIDRGEVRAGAGRLRDRASRPADASEPASQDQQPAPRAATQGRRGG
jgi:CPA2 family monovalent cation:H+ antiporter-2